MSEYPPALPGLRFFTIVFLLLAVAGRPSATGAATCAIGTPGCCTGAQDCDDGNVCNGAETCDVGSGTCSSGTPAADNTICDDANACTQTDRCQAGACVGTNPVICSASDQCHAPGVCDPQSGQCSNPTQPDGTTCNDGNACTRTEIGRASCRERVLLRV